MALTKVTGQVVNTSTDLTVGVLTATTVSIGGTLTYEDVTNVDSVGLITARNGIEVTDKGVQVGTGATVDSAAANTLTFLTGGSERVRIDSSGNVGINTDNPGAPLVVRGGSASNPTIRVEGGSNGNDNARIESKYNLVLACNGDGDQTNRTIQFRNNDTLLSSIDSDGRLLLGTTTEGNSGADDLTIATSGNTGITIRSGTSDYGNIYYSDATSGTGEYAGYVSYQHSTNSLQFATASTERLRIDSSGRLLLGTTTEGDVNADNLTIADSGNCGMTIRSGTSSSGGVFFSDGTSGDAEYRGQVYYDHNSDYMRFSTAASERMRIDSSGRLLVGSVSALDTTTGAITSNNSSSGGRLALGGNPSSAGSSIGEVFGWWNANKVAGLVITSGADTTNKDDGELLFYTSASGPNVQERMRIDRAGNVGIGEASPAHELHVSDASTPEIVAEDTSNNCKAYLGSSDTNGRVGTLSNHDFAFRTNDTEVMRLDSSGRLLVGVTATFGGNNEMLQIARSGGGAIALLRNDTSVSTGNELGAISWYGNDSTSSTYQECATIRAFADDNHGDGDKPTRLVFSTTADGASSPTERMRINNAGQTSIFRSGASGQLQLGTLDGSTFSSHENYMIVYGSAANNYVLNRACNVADGTPSFEIVLGGTRRIEIEADGDIYNVNGTYGTISDARLKENIVDASSQWDDIKDLQVRNFNFTVDSGLPTNTQIGFVAQEVEQVSPGLVKTNLDEDKDGNDLGTTTKTVKTSVLLVKAVKALQESMDRIETLEAKVAALEG